MAADLNLLTPEFKAKVDVLLQKCKDQGFEMRPNEGLRDPFTQGKYWRQSRSSEQIAAKVADLKAQGAPFLAFCIESVGPQHGDPVTNAIPGLGWHQWGEALDCFWVVNGEAVWSTTKKVNGKNGFQIYAAAASQMGLSAGGLWTSLKDWPHVQLRQAANPLGTFTLQQIDAEMKKRFG
ncbi:MAG: M15 family metallopeptidase [Bacteroidetes bacterium]|nr:M15 family metallopeptidase [Bacteroidota bacterium]